ncbi:unnamed protein product [Toxocara canis]|uniref:Aminopeptidase n=1 Tax=Toxocara canis TaxID=6265 RepID=A0A183UG09_TOXCA|nr:unnamed protein product [Toxocara canis]
MVVFVLDGVLKPGEEYIFQILYSGPISDTLAGLYLSQYTDDTGKTRYAAVTQMEPTDARRLAPCFDEPQLKAVWKVRIIHPYGTSAISNGIELINAVKTDNPDWVMTTFKETLPMSSYLIAIAVSDFGFNEGFTSRGTRFRVWAREEALNQTSYALEAGINVLEFFEDYYGIPFPLEKQDMIALPDFSAGAMENWGLITYRERNLLYHSSLYAPMQKQRVAVVVAHELAHQWFGNLVTMNWWNDLWLNEGFATFMEYMGADAISDGNFRMDEYFLADAVNPALRRDAQVTSHPLYFPIEKAEDVNEVFDTITYQKGGSIIHMIEDVMGADNFRKGLNIYLNRFALSNADHNDLWDALNEVVPDTLLGWDGSKLDIRDFASRWTEQMGYPVMEIRRLNSTSVEIRQKRFKLNENAEEQKKFQNPKFGYKYDTPVRYEVNGKEEPMEWLHEDEAKVMEVTPDELLILNSGAHGFYRVNYDPESWQKINDHLLTDHTKIGLRSRARIIDDAFALAEAGHLSYEVALNISNYLRYEDEFLPWWMAAVGLSTILANFGDEPESEHVREYLGSLIAPLYERIDWSKLSTSYLDDKLFFQNELDYLIIGWYCTIRNVDCTERLVDLFKMNMLDACQGDEVLASECSRVPVPIRALVYCEGVKQAAEKVWNKLFELYRRERVQVERDRLLSALTCSRDTFTLKKFLNMASNLNDTTVRLQDVPTVFGGVGGSDVGSEIIFDYFQDNWPQLYRE